ncbi:DUF342 domain-containing protein [Marinicrinis lubricantis]|uniref:DUF342 domain-containing protein n=1 Tax=Marinicrinis lubricantis TaxID=2086470 RepID=A0ABW1IMI9_9BACL
MSSVLDRIIQIDISSDKLAAYLSFRPADEEDITFSTEELEAFVQKHGVRFGVYHDVLSKIAKQPEQYFATKIQIAAGQPPVQGENGFIHLILPNQSGSSPKDAGDGSVDLKEIKRLNNVKKGQPIASRVEAKEGIPGKTIGGEDIPAKPGTEARFKIGKNVVCDPGNTTMYAAIDGLFTYTEDEKMNVFPVYEVNGDVDYSVGNIDFVGNVVVRGNVLTGFKISAAGDIRIVGGVEGAEIEAGGSIEISAGILGHNKGHVIAAQNVKSSFIQDANVKAGKNVIVNQSIMHSQIRAGKAVVCNGSKGLIVGGHIQAGEYIQARTIGNTMSTATVLEVGVLPELRNELLELKGKMTESMDNLDKTDKALKLLDQMAATGQIDKDKLALRVKLSNTRKQTNEELEHIRERMLEIEKALEDSGDAYIEVMSTIYGGSKLVIGRMIKFIKDPIKYIKFHIRDGEISTSSR